MTDEIERASFEQWAPFLVVHFVGYPCCAEDEEFIKDAEESLFPLCDNGCYKNREIEAAWQAWKFRAALSSRGDAPMTQTKSEILLLMDELGVRSAGIERMGEFGEPADFPEIHSHGQAVLRGLSKVRDYILANASPASRGDAGTLRKWEPEFGAVLTSYSCPHCGNTGAVKCEHWEYRAEAESALAHREAPTEVQKFRDQNLGTCRPILGQPGHSGNINKPHVRNDACWNWQAVADREAKQEPEYRVSLDAFDELLQKFKSERAAWQKEREALRKALSNIADGPFGERSVQDLRQVAASALSAAPQPIPERN